MAEAVGHAIEARRHLVVGAGTGTGKSLAYLVPAVVSGRSVVVATATRALQDQLATKDLPLLAEVLAPQRSVSFAVLKGRSNYLCRQRAAEVGGAEESGLAGVALFDVDAELDGGGPGPGPRPAPETLDLGRLGGQLRRLLAWAESSPTGDRAELDFEPNPRAWSAVSVSARECPGAFRCPSGTICFAEKARERAAAADVVVVNTHLYATHVASDGAVLPEHDVVVLDEAHAVEDIMTEALGVEINAARLRALAQATRALVGEDDGRIVDGVAEVADRLDAVLTALAGRRVLTGGGDDPSPQSQELAAVLELAGGRLGALNGALRRASADGGPTLYGGGGAMDSAGPGDDDGARRNRTLLAVGHLGEELSQVIGLGDEQVAWVETSGPSGRTASLRAGAHRRGAAAGPAPVARRHRRAHVGDHSPGARAPPGPAGAHHRPPRGGEPLPVRDLCASVLRQAPPRPPPPRGPRRPARGAGFAHHGGGWSNAGPVHELAGHARRRRRPAPRAPLRGPGPGGQAEGQVARRLRLGPRRLSLRHHVVLAGRRRARADAVARDPRPPPLLAPRRALARGPPGTGRRRGFPPRGPAPGRHPPGPGGRTADPVVDGPGGGGRARLAPGHRQLPPGPARPGSPP